MKTKKVNTASFNELVFEDRNKEYGAFQIRRKYTRTLTVAVSIGVIAILSATITPFLMAKANAKIKSKIERDVTITLDNLEKPDQTTPPPPPPPPPSKDVQMQAQYTAPVIVDTVIHNMDLASIGEITEIVKNDNVTEPIEVKPIENTPEVPKTEFFYIVEEMPEFPGGDVALVQYIASNVKYPEIARENNISGKVYVSFIVNAEGYVEDVKVVRGVDPALDNEAARVIKSLPRWKPGKQVGRPVRVSFTLPISFSLS